MKNSIGVCRIIAILLSAALIGAFFLPLISAIKEYGEAMDLIGDEKVMEGSDIKVSDIKNLSLFEYTRVYIDRFKEGISKDSSLFNAVLYGILGVLGLLSLLWAAVKKPVLLALNSLLAGGAAFLVLKDIELKGVMPDSNHVWGISYYLLYPLAAALLLCAVWMFVVKRNMKKNQSSLSADTESGNRQV